MTNAWQAAVDHLLSTLRHIDGVDLAGLTRRTGFSLPSSAIKPLVAGGLLCRSQQKLRLSEAGWPLADGITRRLCESLVRAPPLEPGAA